MQNIIVLHYLPSPEGLAKGVEAQTGPETLMLLSGEKPTKKPRMESEFSKEEVPRCSELVEWMD